MDGLGEEARRAIRYHRARRRRRPERIEPAGPGQESVWSFPRPPRVERCDALIEVFHAGRTVARSRAALRVVETSLAPSWYLPPEDVDRVLLVPERGGTLCEWKGLARSWRLVVPGSAPVAGAAWDYPEPLPGYEALAGRLSFHPGRVDLCRVDGERARPQPGEYYGGWITSAVTGPFKGLPGSEDW